MHAQGRTHQLALERTHRFMKSPARDLFGNGVAAKFLRQIFHAQVIVAIGQHQAALDDVLQLPHVARPAMPRQGAEKSWSKALNCLLCALANIFRKYSARSGISSALSRSGGIWTRTTETRKYKSSRKVPFCTISSRFRLVAQITRTSMGWETFEPSRSTLRSCSTRKSLACSGRGRSPISSRKSVPPLAASKRPRRIWLAPVNAPFSCPKSSSSIRDSGKAQAEKATNGLSARWLRLWIALATTPLPVPLSPVMSTLVWTPATLPTTSFTCSIGSLLPSSPSTCMEERNFWAAAKSRARTARRQAQSKANFKACTSRGWSRKSTAPCCKASKAFRRRLSQPKAITCGADSRSDNAFNNVHGSASPFCRSRFSKITLRLLSPNRATARPASGARSSA